MSELPPPVPPDDGRFATPPRFVATDELLARVLRLVGAMVAASVVLAFLPVPSVIHVLVLLVVPVVAMISAVSYHDAKRHAFVHRHTRRLWEFRHDQATTVSAGEQAAEPVSAGLRRAWLLMALFVVVFLLGLVLAGLSAGVSERLYG